MPLILNKLEVYQEAERGEFECLKTEHLSVRRGLKRCNKKS